MYEIGSDTLLYGTHRFFVLQKNNCNIDRRSKTYVNEVSCMCTFVLCASIIQNKHNICHISMDLNALEFVPSPLRLKGCYACLVYVILCWVNFKCSGVCTCLDTFWCYMSLTNYMKTKHKTISGVS